MSKDDANQSSKGDDTKARMLAALEKKNKGAHGAGKGTSAGSKIHGESGANTPKMFRRKSGG
jgi:hypothetical protein